MTVKELKRSLQLDKEIDLIEKKLRRKHDPEEVENMEIILCDLYDQWTDESEKLFEIISGRECPRDRLILLCVFAEGLTRKEIGKICDLSEVQVSRIVKRILQEL